jgi:hypothetical protein
MQGTRLPDAVMGVPGPGWEAWGDGREGSSRAAPGSYMKVSTGRRVLWYIVDPDGEIGSLGYRHTVTEHDDGSITVSPSILADPGRHAEGIGDIIKADGWHGFLEHGVWRSV